MDEWRAALAAVETLLVAEALGKPAAANTLALGAEEALAATCAVAAKFLAVSTPRTLALVNLGDRGARFVAAQAAYAAARDVLTWTTGDPPRDLAAALAADIVIAAGPVTIERRDLRGGTHLTALDPGVAIAPDLASAAEHYDRARLAEVVAGLVDGRQADEITILVLPSPAGSRATAV